MVVDPRTARETRLFTVADYDLLPDDGPRHEVIDGVLLDMPAPTLFHQQVLSEFNDLLKQHVRRHRLGMVLFSPVDVEFSRLDIVQPDLVFVSRANAGVVAPSGRRIIGAPDLVVAASSPRTTSRDLGAKHRLYRAHGVREYWFIDVEARALLIWALEGDDDVEVTLDADGRGSRVLPELHIDVAALMALAASDLVPSESGKED